MSDWERRGLYHAPLRLSAGQRTRLRAEQERWSLAERQLREHQDRFKALLLATSQVLWTTDPAGADIVEHASWCEFTGQTPPEVVNWGWLAAIHPEDRPRVERVWKHAVLTRTYYEIEHLLRRHDGVYRHMWTRGVPVLNSNGTVREWVGACADITERQEAEEALKRAHARTEHEVALRTQELQKQISFTERVFQNIPAAIAYLDSDLVYRLSNPYNDRMMLEEPLVGRHVYEAFPGSEEVLRPIFEAVLGRGESIEQANWSFHFVKDGVPITRIWDAAFLPFKEGDRVEGVLLMGVEVSARVEKERLQQEQVERLRQIDQYKDEFLSVISHELRTPLNFITGFASILEDEVSGPLNPDQREYVRKILNGSDRMLGLVNNLLDMSQIAVGKFTLSPSPCLYRSVVEEVVDSFRPLAAEHRITLETDVHVPGELMIDGQRIMQVLTNLVSNAIKFTPQGGRVKVVAYLNDGEIQTEVRDTGIGIAAEDIPKLFRRFSQLDMSATRAVGGTGLGLSISKTIVEAHGGQIGVFSTPGEGSRFWFTLPREVGRVPPERG